MTAKPIHAGAARRFTLGRAVAIGVLASLALVAAAVVAIPERSTTLADAAPKAAAALPIDSLPPPAPRRPEPAAVRAEASPPAMPAMSQTAAPPSSSAALPAAIGIPSAAAQVPAAPAQVPAPPPAPPSDRRFLGAATVSPPDSEWTPIDGTLGCPAAAPGSVMEMLCALNAQSLAREYQLKLMEQDARKAEIASRRAQAEATRREAERRMSGSRAELPPIDSRATATPAPAPAGPLVIAIRGQGAQFTAILRLADGASATVKPGTDLPGGLRVLRIDRDGVVVRGAGGERRLSFAQAMDPGDESPLPRLGNERP